MNKPPSKFYQLPECDGLEALLVHQYNTPFPFHFHPTFNITLIYEGSFNTQLSDRLLNAPSGSILITNPQEIHANPFDKLSLASFFTFYVSKNFLEYCNNEQPVFFDQKVIDDPALFTGLHQLSTKIAQADHYTHFEKGLKSALSNLAAKYGCSKPDQENSRYQSLFDDLLEEDNLAKFSLTGAAHRFGIDKYKFIRLFKFQTGLTPNNYFILKRIEKSKALLKERKDVFSIAIDLGFYDAAHYCNHFKKFTGISPTAYITGS